MRICYTKVTHNQVTTDNDEVRLSFESPPLVVFGLIHVSRKPLKCLVNIIVLFKILIFKFLEVANLVSH